MTSTTETSYLDTATLLAPTFSPTSYANTLIHATNNASDTPLDLSTPLSRVLFDVQEVDTRIDALTTTNAEHIVAHTQTRALASGAVLVWFLVFATAVVSFVTVYEQPTLRDTYGASYDAYCRAVPGWWPRLTPWRGPASSR